MPGIAAQFHLSPMLAGFACSLWGFARLGTFLALWFWTGWHYRFRWLVTALACSLFRSRRFSPCRTSRWCSRAQIFFGVAIGLIYYSSLFYSMDASETKGEHGGIHEAAIGVGNFVGPGVGAASLQFLPQYANSGALAVSALLLAGWARCWRSGKRPGEINAKAQRCKVADKIGATSPLRSVRRWQSASRMHCAGVRKPADCQSAIQQTSALWT